MAERACHRHGLITWRQEGAGTCLSCIGTHICQRERQEEEHRISDSRECGLRHHQVNQDQARCRREFKEVHAPAEISTPFYSHGSDMSILVVVKLSHSSSLCRRRRHCTCARRPRVSGARLGTPGPGTRSRRSGGFFSSCWRTQSGRPEALEAWWISSVRRSDALSERLEPTAR